MLVSSKITIDLTRKEFMQYLYATQNDSNTRAVEITLLANKQPWQIPENVTGAVSFKKPDKTSGLYDVLPDGVTHAVAIEGNIITAILAPQVLTVAGDVPVSIALYDAELNRLGTFPFILRVEKDPSGGQSISNNYYYFTTLDMVNKAVGDLNQLHTTSKTSLVDAINEIFSTGGGSGVYTLAEGESIEDVPPEYSVVIDPYAEEGASLVVGVYTLAEGETVEDAPADADVVIDPYAEPEIPLTREDIPEIVDEVLSKLPTWTGGSY